MMVTRAMATIGIEARGSTWICFWVSGHWYVSRVGGFGLYFADKSVEGETSVSGKGPDHARCGGEEPDDCTPGEGDYD